MRKIFFFFNDTATTEIYTLSLHDALPIWRIEQVLAVEVQQVEEERDDAGGRGVAVDPGDRVLERGRPVGAHPQRLRSEEHTSELQSQSNLVCRLLLEKKKN